MDCGPVDPQELLDSLEEKDAPFVVTVGPAAVVEDVEAECSGMTV
ncbi:hypothetical protein GCM10010981_09530 [Dyella nitratireducens]|uniref:Uncharacterized protein n=1 Tax=Dyella nitratireducens TaxID=1849580 RepID=A0ABQ1FMY1_9GAMM|nr:hypothetical protein GCM10010981_09530 [Dyella nitratireducens]GLQ43985.1 hypothetical protein GCM10007902_38350 [Dyella nitratireducens]